MKYLTSNEKIENSFRFLALFLIGLGFRRMMKKEFTLDHIKQLKITDLFL